MKLIKGQLVGQNETIIGLKDSIGFKAIVIVVIVAIIHQFYIMEFPDDEEMTFGTFTYGISGIIAGIAAFIIGKRYWGSQVFGKTYLALGIAFCFIFAGDLTYIYYDWFTDEAPYPSMADVFFLLFYPFAAYHLVKNIKYFKKNLSWAQKIGVPILAGIVVAIFAFMSIDLIEEEPFDFYFGLLFVLASSVILALAILGAAVFRDSILGKAWLLLAGGIFIFTVADVWYYYLEVIGEYNGEHWVNTLWVLGNSLIIFALIKHKKTI